MENVVLIVHLLLAVSLIAVVLLQRSEGGGLGIGGGGGGATSGRPPTTPMAKVTWGLAIAFIVTSVALTIIAAQNSAGSSVIDRLGGTSSSQSADPGDGLVPDGNELLPPSSSTDPLLPPRAD